MQTDIDLFYETTMGMNTRLEVVMWGQSELKQQVCFNQICAALEYWERLLSRFDPTAEIYHFNSLVENEPMQLGDDLLNSFIQVIEYRQKTKGLFDVFYLSKNSETRHEKDLVDVDPVLKTIVKKSPDVQVDFGGVGKGILLARAIELLDQNEIKNAFISFGGSSIHCRGIHPKGGAWPFDFQVEQGIDTTLELYNTNLSVSGLYHGKGHIFESGEDIPKQSGKSVTIQSQNPIEAEVLSTALFIASEQQRHDILKNFEIEKVLIGSEQLVLNE
ncbi:FAD:protein FMN transferase [Reichenbachiella versicolor]|uniref:FAD:protein FMN transferase n=1 Tax=Reichenbachiella versicolor TaxID=1821036 RepID=UPI000D6DE1B7|nr:FAD:protein FMN transferase [Reichenbachiella versicolor]